MQTLHESVMEQADPPQMSHPNILNPPSGGGGAHNSTSPPGVSGSGGPNHIGHTHKKHLLLGRQRSYVNDILRRSEGTLSNNAPPPVNSSGQLLLTSTTSLPLGAGSNIFGGVASPSSRTPPPPKHRRFVRSRSAYIGPIRYIKLIIRLNYLNEVFRESSSFVAWILFHLDTTILMPFSIYLTVVKA